MRIAFFSAFLLSASGSVVAADNPVADAIDILNNSGTPNVQNSGMVSDAGYEDVLQRAIATAGDDKSLLKNIGERQHGAVLGVAKQPFDILGIRIGEQIATVNEIVAEKFPKAIAKNYFITRDVTSKKVKLDWPPSKKGWYGSEAFEDIPPHIMTYQEIDLGYSVGKMRVYYGADNRLIFLSYSQSMESLRNRQNYVDLAQDVFDKYGYPSFIYWRGNAEEIRVKNAVDGYPFANKDDCADFRAQIKKIKSIDYNKMWHELPGSQVERIIKQNAAKEKLLEQSTYQCLIDASFRRRPKDFEKLSDLILDDSRERPDEIEYLWFCDPASTHIALTEKKPLMSPKDRFGKGVDNSTRYCGLSADIGRSSLTLTLSDFIIKDLDQNSAEQQAPAPKLKF